MESVPITAVEPDYDSISTGIIVSPLHEDFKWTFDGKDVVVPGMTSEQRGKQTIWKKTSSKPMALPACMLVAHHIAQKVVMESHRELIEKTKGEKEKEKLMNEAIPNYKLRCLTIMDQIVEERKEA